MRVRSTTVILNETSSIKKCMSTLRNERLECLKIIETE